MPDKQTADQTARLLTLLPEEIIVDEKLDLRPWQGDEEREMDRIKALSESIKAEGQIEPGIVGEVQLPDGTTSYCLVVGHRCRDAIALANYSLPAHKQIRMSVLVDNCDDRRAAARGVDGEHPTLQPVPDGHGLEHRPHPGTVRLAGRKASERSFWIPKGPSMKIS